MAFSARGRAGVDYSNLMAMLGMRNHKQAMVRGSTNQYEPILVHRMVDIGNRQQQRIGRPRRTTRRAFAGWLCPLQDPR
jgi:hypothetical protein